MLTGRFYQRHCYISRVSSENRCTWNGNRAHCQLGRLWGVNRYYLPGVEHKGDAASGSWAANKWLWCSGKFKPMLGLSCFLSIEETSRVIPNLFIKWTCQCHIAVTYNSSVLLYVISIKFCKIKLKKGTKLKFQTSIKEKKYIYCIFFKNTALSRPRFCSIMQACVCAPTN